MAELKDSGERRDFGTGAVRDAAEGKGRCDLLPLDVVGKILSSRALTLIGEFKTTKNTKFLVDAIREFACSHDIDIFTIIIEVSKQFEDGAKKYAENNWMKGIPLHCYIDSGVRHYLKYLRGDTDEPHDRAFIWNILCAVWTFENKPELDDIENVTTAYDIENPTFKYNKIINKPYHLIAKETMEQYGVLEIDHIEYIDTIYRCACGYLTHVADGVTSCRGCNTFLPPEFLDGIKKRKMSV